ncbi:MAG TPA: class I SAM-dependent methyltransferase [Polyangia bacterium]
MKRRTQRVDKLAQVYDEEILPLWSMRFGRMLLRHVEAPPKAMVLDVGCGTGYPALDVLRKLDDQSRIIAIDCASEMLNVARKKAADLAGRRIFFRTETVKSRLSFTADVYDVVMANDSLWELDDPPASVADFARVAKPGGLVLVTLPMRGSWGEFYDIYREVLTKHDHHDILRKLEEEEQRYPEPEDAVRWLEQAGLTDIGIETEQFELLFRSSREFFFAPVVEFGPLPGWKEVAGKGEVMQEIFWHIKEAIDAYFGDRAFSVTIKAACLHGRKPLVSTAVPKPVEAVTTAPTVVAPAAPPPLPGVAPPKDPSIDEDASTGEIEIATNEIQVVDEVIDSLATPADEPDEEDDADDVLRK